MMPFLNEKCDCTACSACQASCPVQCITMQPDSTGFLYPIIDKQKCIHCHRCEMVCPALHAPSTPSNLENRLAFATITKSTEIWQQSASGGAFNEICRAWGKDDSANTWVFGATFKDLRVIHQGVLLEHISLFYKSKYVQSHMDNCFCQVKDLLKQGKRVVFSGTPCQVAGLRNFLRKDVPGLLCIDLICHGVGSPAVFQQYLSELAQKTGKKIRSYTFRVKHACWGNFPRYQSQVMYEDGSSQYCIEDNYNKLFLNQLCLRDSCGESCRYRQIKRYGDFTIADFNCFTKIFPNILDERSYSTLICNTEKANSLLPVLQDSMALLSCPVEEIKKYNPLLVRTTPENPQRTACLEDFAKGQTIEKLVDKYVARTPFSLRSWVRTHTPCTIKRIAGFLYKKICQ